jgi:hypothetical protein
MWGYVHSATLAFTLAIQDMTQRQKQHSQIWARGYSAIQDWQKWIFAPRRSLTPI